MDPDGLGRRTGCDRRVGGATSVNPAELQILASRLTSIADEMGAVLRRAAYSPNIKERADCSAALFTASGELLAQAEHIPVHLGLDAGVGRGGDRHRSPGADGAQRSVRRWYPSQRHHHGGAGRDRRPARGVGGQPCPSRRRRWQRTGFDAPRRPDDRRGGTAPAADGARRRGAGTHRRGVAHARRTSRRPRRAARRQPPGRGAASPSSEIFDALAEILDYGERRMRAALAALPDGRWTFTDVLDSAGPRPGQQAPTPHRGRRHRRATTR